MISKGFEKPDFIVLVMFSFDLPGHVFGVSNGCETNGTSYLCLDACLMTIVTLLVDI